MSKKKVLIFIPTFPVLTETFIEREVSQLAKSDKLDLVVVSMKKGSGVLSEASEKVTSYQRLDREHFLKGFSYIFKRPAKVLKAFSLVWKNPNRSIFGTLYLFLKSLGYAKIFEEHSPDIIYSHFMSESSTICLIASKVLGVELAIAGHAKDVLQVGSRFKSENSELVAEKAKNAKFVVVCNKNACKRVMETCGAENSDNIKLLYHGINAKELLEQLKAAPSVKKPKKPVIFFVGRFVEKKGIKYLVEASKVLKDRGFDHLVYMAVGEGPLYSEIKRQIESSDLKGVVKILGGGKGVKFSEILSYFKIADLFVFPGVKDKKGDTDGVPNVLIESALLGIPTVATDSGSITDFISHNKSALIVRQRDPKGLAAAMEKVLKDEKLQKKLVEGAHKKALEMFNLKNNVSEVEELLLK